jgi:DNA polymerase-3 subunit delta'
MAFRDILGQEQLKAHLLIALQRGTLSHAYIFEGPKGSGRTTMAMALIQAAHCLAFEEDACGQCLECRKVFNHNHPDVVWIAPQGSAIKIEQIRDLQKQFAYRSASTKPRVYVLQEAEKLTLQASNALLKFIEEPTSNTIAIMLTENGQALLPTIRSRSQRIFFHPQAVDMMENQLLQEGFPREIVLPAVRLVPGIEAARELIQTEWFAEMTKTVLELIHQCIQSFATADLWLQSKLSNKEFSEHIATCFDLFILWCRDILLIQNKRKERIVYVEHLAMSQAYANKHPLHHIVTLMDEALRCKKSLRGNANVTLTIERFLMKI